MAASLAFKTTTNAGPSLGLPHRSPRSAVIARVSKKAREELKQKQDEQALEYGANWYERTRQLSGRRTVREEIEYRRMANLIANNGKERKDLYTENWDGSEYKGSPWNIATFIAFLFFAVPIAGLAFAYWSYGTLWG